MNKKYSRIPGMPVAIGLLLLASCGGQTVPSSPPQTVSAGVQSVGAATVVATVAATSAADPTGDVGASNSAATTCALNIVQGQIAPKNVEYQAALLRGSTE